MAGMEPEARKIMADLDASGNTTKAATKTIAIASAVIAAVSLFGAFVETTGLEKVGLNIADPIVFIGLLVGGALPFLFSASAIRAVSRAAGYIIEEVRSQFKIPGVLEGTVAPDYARVVTLCVTAAQKELIGLAIMAIFTPLAIGFLLKQAALGAFLAGIIVTGQLLAVFMAASGASWDNAKKKIEDGFYGGKGSDTHKAAVTCDTVGDPLKDTSGPALNPMIKVINLISLIFAPLILALADQPMISYGIGVILVAVVAVVIWFGKREGAFTKIQTQSASSSSKNSTES
jgi:K(+)-stimulated pyrophosphate-energized sodium pump